jgi:beta-phosphoglucomutase-like phosphatase (HAD superfamily)
VDDITHPKPDPEIYLRAAGDLGLTPRDCLAFEDSKAGVESARKAGCALVTLQTLYDAKTLGSALLSAKDFTEPALKDLLGTFVL